MSTIGAILLLIAVIGYVAYRIHASVSLASRLLAGFRSGSVAQSGVWVERARHPGRYWLIMAGLVVRFLVMALVPVALAVGLAQFILQTRT